jgi:MFS family permease
LSEKKKSRRHIFFGWWTVAFSGIISGLGHGFNVFGISVLFLPISTELGLNRAATSWAPGVGRLQGGITSPLVGWLSDKFGTRWIVIFGITVAGLGMIMMNYITEVWQYYVAWGALIGLGLNIGLTVAVDKTINDWFMRRRGLAQGIKFASISILGIIVVQVITLLIEATDWRFVCLLFGIIMLASTPFAYALIRPRRPEYYGLLPDGADTGEPREGEEADMVSRSAWYASSYEEIEYTFKQAVKTGTFWLLLATFSVHNIVAGGFNLHIHPFLTDAGLSETAASGVMGMMIFFTLPSRFFGGLFADRVPKNRIQYLLTIAFLFQVVGLGIYLLFQNIPAAYVLLACHGLSTGAVTPLVIVILGRYFGRKAFGSILGTTVAVLAPLGMLAPVFYGWVFDTTGNYNNAFITALVLAVMAMLISCLVRIPKLPAEEREELRF